MQNQTLTERQKEIIDTYIECGSITKAAKVLNSDRKNVRRVVRIAESKGMAPWLSSAPQPEHLKMVKTTVHFDGEGNIKNEWRRSIPELDMIEEFVDELCEKVKGKIKIPRVGHYKVDKDKLLEIDIYDPHIGMYADAQECGEEYNTEKASKRVVDAVTDLCERSGKPEKAVIVFGGDIFHTDNRSNRTEMSGHILDVEYRYQRLIDHVSTVCCDCVNIVAGIARNIDIVVIPGNHDWHSSVWLQKLLKAFYKDCKHINIVDQQTPRKHMVWGKNLLVWAHGDNVPANKWQQVVSAELAEEWGKTKHRHLKLGHIHHKKSIAPIVVDEQAGLLVEFVEALCPPDAWHTGKGFVGSARGASAFVYDKEWGLFTRHLHHPKK